MIVSSENLTSFAGVSRKRAGAELSLPAYSGFSAEGRRVKAGGSRAECLALTRLTRSAIDRDAGKPNLFARTQLPIPTKKIVYSELMTIRSSPKDAVESIVVQMIVTGQEKGLACAQHHFVSWCSAGAAVAKFA